MLRRAAEGALRLGLRSAIGGWNTARAWTVSSTRTPVLQG